MCKTKLSKVDLPTMRSEFQGALDSFPTTAQPTLMVSMGKCYGVSAEAPLLSSGSSRIGHLGPKQLGPLSVQSGVSSHLEKPSQKSGQQAWLW